MGSMQRGSLAAGVLSLLGAAGAFAVVAVLREPVGMYTAIGIILCVNAAVRFRLASQDLDDIDDR